MAVCGKAATGSGTIVANDREMNKHSASYQSGGIEMKHRTTRFLSVLISVLMLVSLLPAPALANDNAIRIYTSPDGLEAGAYYFDMDSGDLYALLEGRRYNEKLIESGSSQEDAEAYAEAQAPLHLAAFRQAAWSIDPDSLMLDAVFPQGYDPSAVFSLEDSSDWAFMLRLLRLAGEDALECLAALLRRNHSCTHQQEAH